MTDSARDFSTIGVIGLGTMGAGIAEVFARNGFDVIGVELNDEALERGRQHLEHSTGRAVKRGKLTEERAGRAARPDHASPPTLDGPRRGRPGRRGRRGVARDQEGDLPRRSTRSSRPDAILATNTSSLSRHRDLDRQHPPGPGHRRALLQPGAGAEARRDHPHRRHRAGACSTTSRRCVERLGKNPVVVRRQGRLHRQHAALRLPQPRRRRCTRATTPPARTSTPRCASAAATRWARWRCST